MTVTTNTSLKEIAGLLKRAKNILIFTHTNPDGDAIGSSVALCHALRTVGKNAWVLLEEDPPKYIGFIDNECCTTDRDASYNQDISVCVDCSEYSRFEQLSDIFDRGRTKTCLDHHVNKAGFGDYYYIDEMEAAASQIVYKLIKEMDVEVDRRMAEAIYTGISTDTGCFQYSNTTAETHRIAAELIELGINHMGIVINLYQNTPLKKLKIQSMIIERAELIEDGRVAISYVSEEMLRDAGAEIDDAEGAIDLLRNISGVEIAVFLKERGDAVKVSFRAKSFADVRQIASAFGGGGHVKAAGCTLNKPMKEAVEMVKEQVADYWVKQGN